MRGMQAASKHPGRQHCTAAALFACHLAVGHHLYWVLFTSHFPQGVPGFYRGFGGILLTVIPANCCYFRWAQKV